MSQPLVEWGVASRPYPGELESGDRHVVAVFETGVLLAAVDGLGHGEEAAAAARSAVKVLESQPNMPLVALVRNCHAALVRSRGVVMSLAAYDGIEKRLAWMGIGNVEGVLLRANPAAHPSRETLLLRRGVVGLQLPSLGASVLPVSPGDRLVLSTDGVKGDFVSSLTPRISPQALADTVLTSHYRQDDDALVLVVEFKE
jgi:hypothetical protein